MPSCRLPSNSMCYAARFGPVGLGLRTRRATMDSAAGTPTLQNVAAPSPGRNEREQRPSYFQTTPAARGFRDSPVTPVMEEPPITVLDRGHGRLARHDPNPSAGCRCHTPMIWVAGVPPAWSFGKRAGRRRDARSPWALPPQLLPNHTRQRAGSGTLDQAIHAALREIPGATPARSPF